MQASNRAFAPYIGITDFMTSEQSLKTLRYFAAAVGEQALAALTYPIPHKLMVGVMMSYKTLHGMDTKWTKAFPKNEEVSSIFVNHPLAFNTLHYADYTNSDVPNSLDEVIRFGGWYMHALQLDMVWPDPAHIAHALSVSRKPISIILQVGKDAMEGAGGNPQEVIARLQDYGDVLDGVLYDKSMGQGKPMDPEVLLPFVEATYEKLPRLRVAVAGGLGPMTMDVVKPLIAQFPDISIDAQGRLRPSGNALDPIDWNLANEYLDRAVALFQNHQP